MRKDLPSGTLTLLFTDIEGSTALLRRAGDSYADILSEQRRILRSVFGARGGFEVDTQGDSFFFVFERVTAAIEAAAEAQRAIQTHAWRDDLGLSVRMGLHTGEPSRTAEGYVGLDVHRAARIAQAAHGGQVLVSPSTAAIAATLLPCGTRLVLVGEFALKDFGSRETLYQLSVEGLRQDFPPPRSVDTSVKLPPQLSSFIGRERELRQLAADVAEHRLLSLIGPGGTGKTRLALALAADPDITRHFAEGISFVELAPVSDGSRVAAALIAVLGLREDADGDPLQRLVAYLRGRHSLVILDNCEHVIADSAELAEKLLSDCPDVRIVVTSREALGISGESVRRIPSMSLPEPGSKDPRHIGASEAVKLFVERAANAGTKLDLNKGNAADVADICRRLDGIPLAIELAASRIKLLSLKEILRRLDDRFRLLTGGNRNALPRQQTLGALIDWSYDLLSDGEKALFRTLSVFVGGWTIEAAERVCKNDVLQGLSGLFDKSLVTRSESGEGSRYFFLETIRQYARDRLLESGETERVRDDHLAYFAELARRADQELRGFEQSSWLALIDQEQDNLRAALEWSGTKTGQNAHLELAIHLWRYWRMRSSFAEGRRWLTNAIERGADAPELLRARAMMSAGSLANYQADYAQAFKLIESCLNLYRKLETQGDSDPATAKLLTDALNMLAGNLIMTQHFDEAMACLTESLERSAKISDTRRIAYAYSSLGNLHMSQGSFEEARTALQRCLDGLEILGDRWWIANTRFQIAWVLNRQGKHQQAWDLLEDANQLVQGLEDKRGLARIAIYRADVQISLGNDGVASTYLLTALHILLDMADKWWISVALEALAGISLRLDKPGLSAVLFSVSCALHKRMGAPVIPVETAKHEKLEADLRKILGTQAFEREAAVSENTSFEEVIALAAKEYGLT